MVEIKAQRCGSWRWLMADGDGSTRVDSAAAGVPVRGVLMVMDQRVSIVQRQACQYVAC
jgi:hypothetical protein